MGNRVHLALGAACLALGLPAAAQTWSTVVRGPGGAEATLGSPDFVTRALAADTAGNTVVTGSYLQGTNRDFLTTKISSTGAVAWQKTFAGAAGRTDAALAAVFDSAGNVIVTGLTFNATGTADVKTIKYAAADGAVLWERTFDGGRDDTAYALALDASQNVLVATEGINAAGNADIRVLKLAAGDGALSWQRAFDGGNHDYVNDIAVDAAGDVIVAGVSINAAGNTDLRTLKLSGASGAILWNKTYDGGGDDQVYSLGLDAGGNAIVAGFATVGTRQAALAIKYAGADGRVVWQRTLDGGNGDSAQAIALDASGNAALAIQSGNAAGNIDMRTVKLAALDGAILWDKRADSGGNDLAYQVAFDSAGNVVTVGSTVIAQGDTDWKVLRYAAADGAILDQASFTGTAVASDDAIAVAVAGAAVFVGGSVRDAGAAPGVRVARFAWGGASGIGTPAPTSPAGTVASATPPFIFNAVPNATSYAVEVWGPSGLAASYAPTPAQAGCPANTGQCSIASTTSLANAGYSWRMRAYNGAQAGGFSGWMNFTVSAAQSAPATPVAVSPKGTIATATPAFVFNAVANAGSYTVEVWGPAGLAASYAATPAQAGCAAGTGQCTIASTMALANNTGYSWRMRTQAGGFGGWTNFTVANAQAPAAPAAPTLVLPRGTIADTLKPTFVWNAVAGATAYRVYVENAQGVAIDATVTAAQSGCPGGTGMCDYTPATPLGNDKPWTWSVKASSASGTSGWSAGFQIYVSVAGAQPGTASTPPAAPRLISPAGTITTQTPTYLWYASAGATSYRLYVQNMQGGVIDVPLTPAQAGCIAGTGMCAYAPASALGAGQWTWSVDAYNAAGSSWSEAFQLFVSW